MKKLKSKYPEINLDKIESKIKSLRESKIVLGKHDDIIKVKMNVKDAPGELDISAKIRVKERYRYSGYSESEFISNKHILFKGIKVKGKVNDYVRKLFGMRIYVKALDILVDDKSII
jgi:hypothetical protein